MTLLDLLALALYLLYAGAILGGLVLAARTAGWLRLGGLGLAVEGLFGAALLTLMSSKYWFGDAQIDHALVDVSLRDLALTSSGVLATTALLVVSQVGLAIRLAALVKRGSIAPAVATPMVAVVLLGAGGTAALVALSRPPESEIRAVEQRVVRAVPGFAVERYAAGSFRAPTGLAFGPDRRLYVSDQTGRIWALADSAGQPGPAELVAEGFDGPVGLAWHGEDLFVASYTRLTRLRGWDAQGRFAERHDILTGLPARLYPWHQNNGPAVGPDGRLYFGVGADANSKPVSHGLAATVVSVEPDGGDLRVVATGLRNVFKLAFNSAGDLFGGDNGPATQDDWPYPAPPDELNQIVAGGDYGFPGVYGVPPFGSPVRAPIFLFGPHASPDGLAFYRGAQFPNEYDDNAFIALWYQGDLYRVQLARAPSGAYLANGSVFATGFRNPLDVAVGPDGMLYVADYGSSVIYRIRYAGEG